MDAESLLDFVGRLRYGMPTDQKEALAASGTLPGAPVDRSADQAAANRYASGYLFTKNHPTIAPMVMPLVSQLRTSTLPGFGGDSPELQSLAISGMNTALAQTPPPAPMPMTPTPMPSLPLPPRR